MSAKATVDEPPLPGAAVTRSGAWLPEVDVRDVDVTSDDNTLTIAGARRDRLHTGGVPFSLERPTGKFFRSLRLPDGCDAAELEAHIQAGVLEVRIPKAAHTTPNPTSDVRLRRVPT